MNWLCSLVRTCIHQQRTGILVYSFTEVRGRCSRLIPTHTTFLFSPQGPRPNPFSRLGWVCCLCVSPPIGVHTCLVHRPSRSLTLLLSPLCNVPFFSPTWQIPMSAQPYIFLSNPSPVFCFPPSWFAARILVSFVFTFPVSCTSFSTPSIVLEALYVYISSISFFCCQGPHAPVFLSVFRPAVKELFCWTVTFPTTPN